MSSGIAFAALAIEAGAGYPDWLFRRIGHPVTWFGALISTLDARLNRPGDPFELRRLKGVAALAMVAATALVAGAAVEAIARALPHGQIALALVASSLLAQKSLHAHVAAVERGLRVSLEDGRREVAKIVGRDVASLDAAGVARAAIESLAENFSDGIVAPALFLAVFGLPGALLYKAVNTADSMIGHRSEKYAAFGWAAARFDDLLNLFPARLAAGLIVAAAWANGFLFSRAFWRRTGNHFGGKRASAREALGTALRDAPKHESPNAGWPEAAMAGALGLALGGPRAYAGAELAGAMLGSGRREATPEDISSSLTIYRMSAAMLWLIVLAGALAGLK